MILELSIVAAQAAYILGAGQMSRSTPTAFTIETDSAVLPSKPPISITAYWARSMPLSILGSYRNMEQWADAKIKEAKRQIADDRWMIGFCRDMRSIVQQQVDKGALAVCIKRDKVECYFLPDSTSPRANKKTPFEKWLFDCLEYLPYP